MRRHSRSARRWASAWTLMVGLCGACGCGSSGDGSGVTFHGEQQALPGFSYDTGYQPTTPPVQVRMALSASGSLSAEARATGSGDSMTPEAASGLFTMDAHLEIHTTVKINVVGVGQMEGPIPGAPVVDLAFGGETGFEPFLLGGTTANVTADVPETQLADIPLGSIPGRLVIKALGTVGSEFAGVCAQARDGVGQYTGATTTGGTVIIRPSVVLEIPMVGDQTYDIPEITVTIPPGGGPMDLGIKSLPDGTDAAGPGPCSGNPQDGGALDGGQNDGGGSCRLSCTGCCQGNECKSGSEASACGKGGQECAACHGSSPYCVEGVCTGGASCNLTCSGCCDGDQCRTGNTAAACGLDGFTCAACQGSDQCVNGYCKGSGSCASTCSGCCVGESCQGGTTTSACGSGGATCATCPSHFRCGSARACEVDPTSLWDIVAVDAQLPALDPQGASWDPFSGLPDGYVTVYTYLSGTQHLSGKSTTIDDTLTPAWNAVVLSGVLAGEILDGGLGFALYDEDPTSFDDLIDSCSGFVPEGDFDGQPHAACGGLIPMRYKLVPH